MKTKFITIFLFLIIPKVFGYDANWTLAAKDINNADIFFDFENISKNESGNYLVWTLINNYKGDSSLNIFEIDCHHFRTRITYYVQYSEHYAKGKKIPNSQLKIFKRSQNYIIGFMKNQVHMPIIQSRKSAQIIKFDIFV